MQVNKIRELPKHSQIVVTHTDAKELYLWNTETQPNHAKVCTGFLAPADKGAQ